MLVKKFLLSDKESAPRYYHCQHNFDVTWITGALFIVIFGVAFGAAALLDHLLRDRAPTDSQPNGEPNEIWPRWHSQFNEPMVYRQSDRMPYCYVVLPRPS